MTNKMIQSMKLRYERNAAAKVGEECTCPACGTVFVKKSWQQKFCKSKRGTKCKDKYWNNVDPEKRCNTTRISPASAAWMSRENRVTGYTSEGYRIIGGVAYDEFGDPVYNFDPYENIHPLDLDDVGCHD